MDFERLFIRCYATTRAWFISVRDYRLVTVRLLIQHEAMKEYADSICDDTKIIYLTTLNKNLPEDALRGGVWK